MNLFYGFIVASCFLTPAFGAKILGILLMPSPSHSILLERLIRELSNRGHEVTYITPTDPKSFENVNLIHVPGVLEFMTETFMNNQSMLTAARNMGISRMSSFVTMGPGLADYMLAHPEVQNLLNSDKQFDLIFGEIMMNEGILAGLSQKYKAPIVALAPFLPNHFANYLVGNPSPASFIPESMLPFSTNMTFVQRLTNFVVGSLIELAHGVFLMPAQDANMRKHFGDDLPPLSEIIKNTSLVLVNHHYSLGFPRPYVPNMIEVGGMHVNDPKPLPKNLQTYMDDAEHGVILFSLGSVAKSADMGPDMIADILQAFSKVKQNVLWKFEQELTDVPSNVKVMKWLPQSDILAHPNLKLFITHGGMLSTTESALRGVPVLGIPLFGDQPINMKLTEASGSGRTLDFDDIKENTLYELIEEMIGNPKYKEAALYRSSIFKDTATSSMEKAIWWIEYVLRHKGAPHLRSAAQDLTWYQYYLLDIYLLLFVILTINTYISIKITKCVLRKLCHRFSKCSTNKEKKNN